MPRDLAGPRRGGAGPAAKPRQAGTNVKSISDGERSLPPLDPSATLGTRIVTVAGFRIASEAGTVASRVGRQLRFEQRFNARVL
jgi:hypothetical protein